MAAHRDHLRPYLSVKIKALLVHGIGEHSPGEALRQLVEGLDDLPLGRPPDIEIEEVYWSHLIERRLGDTALTRADRGRWYELDRRGIGWQYGAPSLADGLFDYLFDRLCRLWDWLVDRLHGLLYRASDAVEALVQNYRVLADHMAAIKGAAAVGTPLPKRAGTTSASLAALHAASTIYLDSLWGLLLPLALLHWLFRVNLIWPALGLFILSCGLQMTLGLLDRRWSARSAIRKIFLTAAAPLLVITSRLPFVLIVLSVATAYVTLLGGISEATSQAEYQNLIIDGYSKLSTLTLEELEASGWSDFISGPVAYFGAAVLLALLAGVLSVLLGILRHLTRPLRPFLKIIADSLAYVGDEGEREGVTERLRESLERSLHEGCDVLLICGHSLGSIIALDCLRNLSESQTSGLFGAGKARVVLVTGGSPYKRIFRTWFRERYPAASDLREQLQRRIGSFEWYNFFRPYEPVGTSLGLGPAGDLDVYSSREDRRVWNVLNAHFGYWSDARILAAIRDVLASPTTTTTDPVPATGPEDTEQGHSIMQYLEGSRAVLFASSIPIVVVACLGFIVQGAIQAGATALEFRALRDTSQTQVVEGQLHGYLVETVRGSGTYARVADVKRHCAVLSGLAQDSGPCHPLDAGASDGTCVEETFAQRAAGVRAFTLTGETETRQSAFVSMRFVVLGQEATVSAVEACPVRPGVGRAFGNVATWSGSAFLAVIALVVVAGLTILGNGLVQSVMIGGRYWPLGDE